MCKGRGGGWLVVATAGGKVLAASNGQPWTLEVRRVRSLCEKLKQITRKEHANTRYIKREDKMRGFDNGRWRLAESG